MKLEKNSVCNGRKLLVKRVFIVAVLTVMLIGCVGCKDKDPVSPTKFENFMEDKGLTISDETETINEYGYKQVLVAYQDEDYMFGYYFMKSNGTSDSLYDQASTDFRAMAENEEGAKVTEVKKNNYAKLTISTDDNFYALVKKQNVVLQVSATSEYEDEVKEIMKELDKQ